MRKAIQLGRFLQLKPLLLRRANLAQQRTFLSWLMTTNADLDAMRQHLLAGQFDKCQQMLAAGKDPNAIHSVTENPILSDLILSAPDEFRCDRQQTFKKFHSMCQDAGKPLDLSATCSCPRYRTPFHYAAEFEHGIDVGLADLETLSGIGPECINRTDIDGRTALDYTAIADEIDAYVLLLSDGAPMARSQKRQSEILCAKT